MPDRSRLSANPVIALTVAMLMTLSVGSVAAQEQETELEYGPLVTLRPIAAPPIASPAELADGMALGSPDAPVLVEVWEDFQCPFCQRFTFAVKPGIVEEYVKSGDVRLVFRHLAFLGDESHWAAVASALAADQGMFWPYHDHLFANLQGENVGSYSLERLLEIGEVVGLDMDQFRDGLRLDVARERFAAIQAESLAEATALGINSTPTVVVQGVPLRSPDFDTVSAAIDVALGMAEPAAGEESGATGEG